MHEILINVTPQETRVAMLEQAVVQELHVERASARGLVGNICLGKVARVLPGMQSAFVEIGLERAAFLHIADIWEHRQNGHGGEHKPIEKILHEGQALLVQVIKDPIGTKGARLSTQVSLAGRLLVFLPQDSHIGISQRIEDEAERESLRGKLQTLLPEGTAGGFIIRTMAEAATERELATDIEYLTKLWRDLTVRSREVPAPSLLYQDLNLALRVLRDMTTDDTSRVLVDSRETFARMQEFARDYTPALADRLHHYVGERPLFDLHGVEEEIEKALARRVELKSGGYLIIDQTEAMTTIDVNTGGFVGGRSFDDTIFKTNLEAAQVIARQLRLRNLGGIIIIDFIDMENADHRAAVLAELNRALERDRTRLTVNGFTQLGLVEMTRKRTRESLAHVLCEPCPVCEGRGELKTAQTACYEVLRELLREARQFNAR
ncbi:MAG: ribonuclease G, partial [Casimicrobiaceae bacterium]